MLFLSGDTLTIEQKRNTIISPSAPPDILTRALPKVELAGAEGLVSASMNSAKNFTKTPSLKGKNSNMAIWV